MIRISTFSITLLISLFCSCCLYAQNAQGQTLSRPAGRAVKDVLQVIPNPGNGIYQLVFKSEYKGSVSIAVSDAIGKYVYLKTVKDFNAELKESIDISGNPKGIYIFEVESDVNRESKRVIYQ